MRLGEALHKVEIKNLLTRSDLLLPAIILLGFTIIYRKVEANTTSEGTRWSTVRTVEDCGQTDWLCCWDKTTNIKQSVECSSMSAAPWSPRHNWDGDSNTNTLMKGWLVKVQPVSDAPSGNIMFKVIKRVWNPSAQHCTFLKNTEQLLQSIFTVLILHKAA